MTAFYSLIPDTENWLGDENLTLPKKVMRGLERKDSSILTGMQIYHNYIHPHEALNGRTPSEAAGIKVAGENKWLTLIQNASKKSPYES